MKKILKFHYILAIIFILGLLFLSGPGWVYIYRPVVNKIQVGSSANDYVNKKELEIKDIKEGNQSHILWSVVNQKKTKYSLVYLHGFSASPKEISPVIEIVSENLKMNAYFPRFSSHGLKNDLMENLKADQLFQDAEEAYAIGKTIGENVVLIGTSTGASLAIWLASRHQDIAGLILISPNLGIKDPKGFLAAGPLGYWIARTLVGSYYEWKPKHANQELYWSTRYSISGIRAMTDVIREVESLSMGSIHVSCLVLWTARDQVVDIHKSITKLMNLGSDKKIFVEIDTSEHVLAGDITSPETTTKTIETITQFLKKL